MTATTHETPLVPGKLGYDDYLGLPDDGKRYEILDGMVVVTATPVTRHQRVSRELELLLWTHVKAHGLGEIFYAPMTVILDAHTIVEPDLIFVSKGRAGIVTDRAIEGAPDLLVEILSPSTASHDRGAKLQLYARFGVSQYWLVDPDARTLEVYHGVGGSYRVEATHRGDASFRSALFPGLAIDLGRIWA